MKSGLNLGRDRVRGAKRVGRTEGGSRGETSWVG
jgi:hypothetical protein